MRVVGVVVVTAGFFVVLLLLSGQVMYWLRQESVRGMSPGGAPIWVRRASVVGFLDPDPDPGSWILDPDPGTGSWIPLAILAP